MDFSHLRAEYQIRPNVTYLNHGSFGISPNTVRWSRQRWIEALQQNPMDFFLRQQETLLISAKRRVAEFVGAEPGNLVFSPNATTAMNTVAQSFPLRAGDEVLLNSHEYGAVKKIWDRRCKATEAHVCEVKLGNQFASDQEIVDTIMQAITPKTRMVVISHITSATAFVMPVEKIIAACKLRGVATCIDGPHAVAAIDLALDSLGCDFYCASGHKWLAAPLGSGFLYVAPQWHNTIEPLIESWGRMLPATAETWDERFLWQGTLDLSPFLAMPAAIDFLQGVGLPKIRDGLAARSRKIRIDLHDFFGTTPMVPDDPAWFTTMALITLPEGDWSGLQHHLWVNHQIEIQVTCFQEKWYLRVSSYLYNDDDDFDHLLAALRLWRSSGVLS